MNGESQDTSKRVRASELARETGLSKAWISKLSKQRKLLFAEDGTIELSEAIRQIEAARDHRREPQREHAVRQRQEGKEAGADPQVPENLRDIYIKDHPEIGDENCAPRDVGKETQRTILAKEVYNAKLKQIEYFEKIGQLIPLEDIRQAQERIAASVRAHLLTIPAKNAPILEGKTAAQIEALLKSEINSILAEFHGMGARS